MQRDYITNQGRPVRCVEVVDARVAAILRRKSPSDCVEMIFESSRLAREMMSSRIRTEYPNWTVDEVNKEVARRILRGTTRPS